MSLSVALNVDGSRVVLAVGLPEPGLVRCTAVLDYTRRGDEIACRCLIQRTSTGDLADGVRAHYKTVHPERKIQ